ncbi:hypothetical protein [Micromonospora sp. NPDC005806]|uniref:hypothetical protein n=1 Tax=Micromonospora sp. NPDC005806 TaxID=3364234 RepID=UPI0036CA468B
MPDTGLQLGLTDNAYNFLNESMRNTMRAVEDMSQWTFAIVNAAQAIELLLKERLRREHKLLVFTDVDKPRRHTVSLDKALDRLSSCGVELEREDLDRIRRARDLRNDVVHYEVSATEGQLEAAYVDLFEFAHVFHQRELGEELHPHLAPELHGMEAALMERFRRDFVTYQGEHMVKAFPSEIVESQQITHIAIEGSEYERIRYGGEGYWEFGNISGNCHDCGIVAGQLHAITCDMEECPKCRGQLLSCPCQIDGDDEADQLEDDEDQVAASSNAP